MFAAPIWSAWATSVKIGAQLSCICCLEDYMQQFAPVIQCIFHDVIDHQSDNPTPSPEDG